MQPDDQDPIVPLHTPSILLTAYSKPEVLCACDYMRTLALVYALIFSTCD